MAEVTPQVATAIAETGVRKETGELETPDHDEAMARPHPFAQTLAVRADVGTMRGPLRHRRSSILALAPFRSIARGLLSAA